MLSLSPPYWLAHRGPPEVQSIQPAQDSLDAEMLSMQSATSSSQPPPSTHVFPIFCWPSLATSWWHMLYNSSSYGSGPSVFLVEDSTFQHDRRVPVKWSSLEVSIPEEPNQRCQVVATTCLRWISCEIDLIEAWYQVACSKNGCCNCFSDLFSTSSHLKTSRNPSKISKVLAYHRSLLQSL